MAARGAGEVRFLTIQQVANQLGVSDKTVRRWIAGGDLKAHKFGAAVRISADDLRAFIALHRQG
jgi:excisionase family DNA binding protein